MTQNSDQLPTVTSNHGHLASVTPPPSEAGPVAIEMAAAHRRMVDYFRNKCEMSMQEALAVADHPVDAACAHQIRTCEPDQLTWFDMHALAESDPSLAQQMWEDLKRSADDELRSGHRAAKAMEASRLRPWDRVQFVALREELAAQWQPSNGIERTLIDTMAQCHTAFLFWMQQLIVYSGSEPHNNKESIEDRGCWRPPRVTDAQAMEQAGAMADRFHKMSVRTLRALTDLRRRAAPVMIRAGQVNVAQQQVNMAQGARPGTSLSDEQQLQ